jgi:hypothetical protein
LKKIFIAALAVILASCASNQTAVSTDTASSNNTSQVKELRTPATDDLSGAYLGEGLFSEKRSSGVPRPAMRLYLDRAQGEADTYYGVLLEYDRLESMALPYLVTQKIPKLNKLVGYLNNIATRISAYKFVRGNKSGTYEMHNLEVRGGQIVPAQETKMVLTLANKRGSNPLAGAVIEGNSEGSIVFPEAGTAEGSQMKLAAIAYEKGHLASTWRGNWKDLEGSYLSEYGRFKDGVLELYSQGGQPKSKFIKTNTTLAKYFTNPKSATIEGDYNVIEPIPKMYLLVPTQKARAASDKEMTGRIGLFLDVFDGTAPEAGSHMVTELAYINPQDPEDFMMYYEHPEHVKNIGVEPAKR